MTPRQINELHGKIVWSCVRCKTTKNLHWWNGLSVAICKSQKCNDEWTEQCREEWARQDAYDEYVKEHYGGIDLKYLLSILLLLASHSSFAQIIKKPTDMECLVYSVYRESRGSELPQMRAVIDTVQNRAAESGESICTVLKKKSQFPYFKFGVKKIHDRKFLTMFMNACTMPPILPKDFLFFNTKKFKWCGKTKKIEKMYFCKMKIKEKK